MQRRWIWGTLAACLVFLGTSVTVMADTTPVSQLDEIVVTADRNASAKKEVTSNITIIDRQTIASSSANDLGEILSQQGFYTRQYPGTLNSVGIRGYRSDSHGNDLNSRVLVLLNGKRISSGNTAVISLANVERIEVLHGPAAVQYGAAAMGGVVNVITKKGAGEAEDSFTTSVEAGLGSYSHYRTQVNAAANVSNFDAAFGYRYYEQKDYSDGKGDKYKYTRTDAVNAFNVDAGYTFLDLHRIGFNVNYFNAEGAHSPQGVSWISSFANYTDLDKTNANGDINYSGATQNNMFSWFLRYGIGEDKRENQSRAYYTGVKSGNKTKYTVDSQIGQAQLTFNHDFITLTAGYDYLDYDLNDNKIKSEYRNNAVFLLGKLKLFDNMLILSAGTRYDDFDVKGKTHGKKKNEDEFSPSVGVAFIPFSWLKLRANYAHGFIMPAADHIFGGSYYYANPDLKPEKNDTYEAGFDIGWNYLDFSLTYFYSKGKDVLVGTMDNMWMTKYNNWTKAKRAGLEIEFSGDVAKAAGFQDFELRPYLNLNWMNTYKGKDRGNNGEWEKIPYIADLTLGYGLRFAYPEHNFTTSLNFQYFGNEKVNDWKKTATKTYIDHGKFTVVDWTARKQLFELGNYGKMDIKVEVNNLFDKKYAYVDDYPMPGRNFYVGLIYSY